MSFPFQLFGEYDELKITGHTVGYWQFAVKDFHCMAATVYDHPGEDIDMYVFKVWAMDGDDPQLPANHDNKFWFDLRTCDVQVIKRAQW